MSLNQYLRILSEDILDKILLLIIEVLFEFPHNCAVLNTLWNLLYPCYLFIPLYKLCTAPSSNFTSSQVALSTFLLMKYIYNQTKTIQQYFCIEIEIGVEID